VPALPGVTLYDSYGNVITASGGALTIAGTVTAVSGTGTNATQATNTTAIAASVAGNTVIKASAGRIFTVQVTTAGTNAMSFYDNATTASGTIIAQLPASAAVGTYTFNSPAANGITAGGNAANPAVTVSWS
jgi:hypothetical protein